MNTTADEERHAQSRAHIAEVAFGLLVDGGEDRLTMHAIATRLGVQPSSLYTYVRDKEDLLYLVVERALGDPGHPRGDWEARTRDVVDQIVRIIVENPRTACALRAAPALAARMLRERVANAMHDAPFDAGTRNDAANAIGTLLVGLVVWPGSDMQQSEESIGPSNVHACCEFLLAGISRVTQTPDESPPANRNGVVAIEQPARAGKWHHTTR